MLQKIGCSGKTEIGDNRNDTSERLWKPFNQMIYVI